MAGLRFLLGVDGLTCGSVEAARQGPGATGHTTGLISVLGVDGADMLFMLDAIKAEQERKTECVIVLVRYQV